MSEPNGETFTSDYFRREVVSLRQRWGEKSFWDDLEMPTRALQAISYIYFRLQEPTDDDIIVWDATVMEFAKRLELMVDMRIDRAMRGVTKTEESQCQTNEQS